MMLEEVSLSELPIFFFIGLCYWHGELFLEWNEMWMIKDSGLQWNRCFFNPMIQTRLLSSVSVRTCLLRNGVLKLGYILDERGWKSREALQEIAGLKSVRFVSKLKEEICNALPRSCRNWIGLSSTEDMKNVQSFPEIRVLSHTGWQGIRG